MKKMMTRPIHLMLALIIVLSSDACKKNEDNEEEQPANTAPTAGFTVQPASGGTSTVFQFDASGSSDNEDALADLQFRWDWDGNGTWDTQYSSDTLAQHTYTTEGTYQARLEVKDQGGLTDDALKSLTVSNSANNPPLPPAGPNPADGATEVNLSTNLTWTCSDPDGDPLTYDVYFGTSGNPPLVAEDIADKAYDPGALDESTSYYWKVVAKDIKGASTPGPVWEFSTTGGAAFVCGTPFTDPRDMQVYPTVQIGDACWMASNMNIGNRVDGNQGQANDQVIEKFCFNDSDSNCETYGGLYTWDEMMQYGAGNPNQGICPDGWHVPTDVEYMEMEMAIGMPQSEVIKSGLRGTNEGALLKAGGSSGFEGLLGGYHNGGLFLSLGSYGTFFTSEDAANLAWCRYLFNDNNQVLRDKYDKSFAFSVRCIKND